MTKDRFEDFMVLYDEFQDKMLTIENIFGEVVTDFHIVGRWEIDLPYETCSGYRCPGCIRKNISKDYEIHVPFSYVYKTEEELEDIAKNHYDWVESMVVKMEYPRED